MSKLLYLIRRTLKINLNGMRERIDEAHRRCGKPKLVIFFDMINCALRYQAGYIEYVIYGMYDMNAKQRRTVLTAGKNNRYVAALNKKSDWDYFENKIKFLNTFREETRRDFLDLSTASLDDLKAFLAKHPIFMAKPVDGICGKNIEKIDSTELDAEVLFNDLKKSGQTLLEEVILQHPDVSRINPSAINTVRIVTIVSAGVPHVVFAGLRCGRAGSVVDNFVAGGMTVPIDIETGVIHNVAVDKVGNVFDIHPDTNVPFDGFALPDWADCIALAKSAATRVETVKYVGWDIACTPNGPILVEGNHFPGQVLYQLKAQTPDKIGMLPAYEAVIPYHSLERIKH